MCSMTTSHIPLGCLPRKSDCDLQEASPANLLESSTSESRKRRRTRHLRCNGGDAGPSQRQALPELQTLDAERGKLKVPVQL